MKTWKMGLGMGAALAALLAVMACSSSSSSGGGGFSCSGKGSCPNDVAPSQMSIDSCNMAQSDPHCGAKFTALGSCAIANSTCGTDGKSTVDESKCAQQLADYTNCIIPDAGGGGG